MDQPVYLSEHSVWVDKIAFLKAYARSGAKNPYTGERCTTDNLVIDQGHLDKIKSFVSEKKKTCRDPLPKAEKKFLKNKVSSILGEPSSSNSGNRWYGLRLGLFGKSLAYCRIQDGKRSTASDVVRLLAKDNIQSKVMFDSSKAQMPVVVVPEPKCLLGGGMM